MIVSVVVTVLLLYVAFHTEYEGDKFPKWVYYVLALIALASWQSAIVMLGLSIYCIYKGVKEGNIRTISWIENLIK